jgi:uncharacterized protein
MREETSENPFQSLTVRNLSLKFLILTIALAISLIPLRPLVSELSSQALTLLIYILQFTLVCLWVLVDLKKRNIKLKHIIGLIPPNYPWLPMLGLVILILLFSLSAYLITFSLVSLIAPDFISQLLQQLSERSNPNTSTPLLFTLLQAIAYIIVAPITEEFLFRGYILQRWASKWSMTVALVASSILFGVLHANIIGLSMFGLVMGVLYIRTRTLLIPIACHAFNNLIAFSLQMLSTKPKVIDASTQLQQLRSGWWVGVILMLISLPLLVRFLKKQFPSANLQIPYLTNLYLSINHEV